MSLGTGLCAWRIVVWERETQGQEGGRKQSQIALGP